MAFRYLIYSTGTTYSGTILRESAINNPGVGEASLYSNFIIPEIQPLYLWQVSLGTVIPNTDTKINLYEAAVAPAPQPNDNITYGEVTGLTNQKISKFVGTTLNIPLIASSGQALSDSGYNIADIIVAGSGVTQSQFNSFTGTTLPANYYNKVQINSYTGQTLTNINSRLLTTVFNSFTGTTLPTNYYNKTQINSYTGQTLTNINSRLLTTIFSSFTGTTLPANYYNKTEINSYTGQTSTLIGTKVSKLTGATQNDIATFGVGGALSDSGKQFTTTVQSQGLATNANVPTELAVRNAINQAVAAAIILQGDWNASTNTPNLQVTGITIGFAWRVSVSGTTNLGGIAYWQVGDMAVKSAGGWIRVSSQDIAAIWGNIYGNIANQTDLQNALDAKTNVSLFDSFTGTTLPANYYNKTQINSYTGQTLTNINSRLLTTLFNSFTGTTLPANYYNKTQINAFTGTTLPANYYNKAQINSYTGETNTLIGTKLNTSVFTGYTASTKNENKKIQVISTSTANANVVSPLSITWASASPYANDMYTWSGGTPVWIKSAGTYEVQYHILLKNDTANQTHSIGANILKNTATVVETATAGMVVGNSGSGELSLPPVVLTLAVNDRLDLSVFRIGSAGNANLVSGSVFLMINKLT